jgi:hypothetical protein
MWTKVKGWFVGKPNYLMLDLFADLDALIARIDAMDSYNAQALDRLAVEKTAVQNKQVFLEGETQRLAKFRQAIMSAIAAVWDE